MGSSSPAQDSSAQQGAEHKQRQLDSVRVDPAGTSLTTNQGVRVDHTDDSVSVGERGPTLLEDFHAREKVTHFDHERIPEPMPLSLRLQEAGQGHVPAKTLLLITVWVSKATDFVGFDTQTVIMPSLFWRAAS